MATSKEIRYQNALSLVETLESFAEFAKLLDKSESQVNQFMGKNPVRGIGNKIAREIEEAFNKPNGWLDQDHGSNVRELSGSYAQLKKVPLISTVDAGAWNQAVDQYAAGHGFDDLICPFEHGQNTFALRVSGLSMTAERGISFEEGSIVFCDPDQVHKVKSGSFVLAKLSQDDVVTFKQLIIDGSDRFLRPLNDNGFRAIHDDFTILARVIGQIQDC